MIQESINERFHSMGVLLLLDCPSGLEFGIDNISWQIGPKFKGIKLIPLGTHIIAYSLQSQNHMFKMSKFVLFTPQERVIVYRWNERVCEFLEVRGEEAEGYRSGVQHYYFDTHLGPYPEQNLSFWSQTTKYITKPVLEKLDPIDKLQQFQEEYTKKQQNIDEEIQKLVIDEDQGNQIDNQEADQQIEEEGQKQKRKARENPGKFEALSDTIYYSQISRTLTGSPELITKINLDKTVILERILQKQWKSKPEHLLGQLQYSFVHFIIGENQQSLTQWKKIVDLLASSESAYFSIQGHKNHQRLMMDFIAVFYDQLNQFPVDFFRDELSKGNFICKVLKRFKEYSKGEQYSIKIRKRIQKLLDLVNTKFQYEVQESDDEEQMPTVVNEQQIYF